MAYIIPIYAKNEFDFISLSAFFSIIGAAALWWESNHSDAEIVPDFNNITDSRDFTIPGLGWLIYYAIVAAVVVCLGLAFLFKPNQHSAGVILIKSALTVSVLVAGGAVAWHRFNRKSFDLQTMIRVDVIYIKGLPEKLTQDHLTEASRRIRRASKLSRNALRSTGFFFLFVGGCFVLIDELYKVWPEFYQRIIHLF